MEYSTIQKIGAAGCVLIVFIAIFTALAWARKKEGNYEPEVPLPPKVWYAVKIEVTFDKGIKDTFDLEVYDRLTNIWIKNGDVGYLRTTKQTGGVVCGPATVCSFARTFRIISSEKHIVNESE